MHLVVDIDQTLYPLLRAISTLPGGEEVDESNCLTWDSLEGMCRRPAQELIAEAIHPDVAAGIGLYPGARNALLSFADQNIEIALATHRSREYKNFTSTFLHEAGLGDFPLYIGEDLEKESFLFADGLLVDDAPHVLESAWQKGVGVTSLEHPYNKEVAQRLGFSRGRDWDNLLQIINEHLG